MPCSTFAPPLPVNDLTGRHLRGSRTSGYAMGQLRRRLRSPTESVSAGARLVTGGEYADLF
jgi:hypothetical protein